MLSTKDSSCSEINHGKKGGMADRLLQLITLIVVIVFVSSCTAIPPLLPTATTAPTPPTMLPAKPTNIPSTFTPTAIQPTPTLSAPTESPTEVVQQGTEGNKIRITFGDTVLFAIMADNQTAQDFVSMLPLTVTLEDYGRTEKITYLPRTLARAGAPAGYNPSIGDITYYAPWGNLAIFIQDFGYADGLIYLGTFDGNIDALSVSGSIEVSIELVD